MSDRFIQRMSRRTVLGAGLFLGTSWALKSCTAATAPSGTTQANSSSEPNAGGATGGQVVTASFPGTTENLFRDKLAPLFSQTGKGQLSVVPLLAFEQVARLKAAPDNPPFDVVFLDDGQTDIAMKAGLIQPFPADRSSGFSNVDSSFLGKQGLAPIFYMQGVVIGYNPERVKTPPKAWEALLDSNLDGRLGLVSMNSVLGTSFMVEMAKLKGGSESDIEPAFAALKQILSKVGGVAANPGALSTLFQQGEVDVAPMWHNDVLSLKAKGIPVEWVVPESGMIAARYSLNLVSKPKSGVDAAAAYVETALGKEAQSILSASPYYFVPSDKTVQLDAAITEKIGAKTSTEFIQKANVLDWATINQQRSTWIERFNKEVKV
ncbi:ABC transporter substrate-binding protein [Leptolyngbya ohadii]|uniref:ABC transporter substrate-binding protein n=1 Tax=Leptolyngbya ohadii TaxID=1962290 RepID=UPI000B5A04A4|nr:extracellular solute-binding protein [Leptolyngbya ohadii]